MIVRVLNGLASVLGAGAFAQFPEFYQQYLQRLGGRLDQAKLDMDRLLSDAQTLGRTLEAYLEELLNSGTLAARQAAKRELERVENAGDLEAAYNALSQAGPLERPVVFAQHFDPLLAQETVNIFSPALPVTPEGFVYAGLGMLAALSLMAGGERTTKGVAKRLRRRKSAPARAEHERPERERPEPERIEPGRG